MTILNPIEKDELLRALDDLPPEAVAAVREFIEYQKSKSQTSSQAGAVAIRGWLQDVRFSSSDIDAARGEMWARFQNHSA